MSFLQSTSGITCFKISSTSFPQTPVSISSCRSPSHSSYGWKARGHCYTLTGNGFINRKRRIFIQSCTPRRRRNVRKRIASSSEQLVPSLPQEITDIPIVPTIDSKPTVEEEASVRETSRNTKSIEKNDNYIS